MHWIDNDLDYGTVDVLAYELIDWNIQNQSWREMYLGMTGILRGCCAKHNVASRGYTVVAIKKEAQVYDVRGRQPR